MLWFGREKGGSRISILQEYEEVRKEIGHGKYDAIELYLKEFCPQDQIDKMFEELKNLNYETDDWVKKHQDIKDKYHVILLDDVLYKDKEWKKFDKWFMDYIKPFHIMKHDKNTFSVFLDQSDYHYDWVQEKKIESSYYGDGHCYNDIFRDYLNSNNANLNSRLNYDSENGMFCIYCKNKKDAETVCFELSKLYKDEDKMIQLIKDTKQKYNYIFDSKVSI